MGGRHPFVWDRRVRANRWEGNAVVDSTTYEPEQIFPRPAENLHLVELLHAPRAGHAFDMLQNASRIRRRGRRRDVAYPLRDRRGRSTSYACHEMQLLWAAGHPGSGARVTNEHLEAASGKKAQ